MWPWYLGKQTNLNKPFSCRQGTLNGCVFFIASMQMCVATVQCRLCEHHKYFDGYHICVFFMASIPMCVASGNYPVWTNITNTWMDIIPHLKSICLTSLLAATTLTWRPVFSRCSSSWLEREQIHQMLEPFKPLIAFVNPNGRKRHHKLAIPSISTSRGHLEMLAVVLSQSAAVPAPAQ